MSIMDSGGGIKIVKIKYFKLQNDEKAVQLLSATQAFFSPTWQIPDKYECLLSF